MIHSSTIKTLQRPTWFDNAGFNKGLNHDRQHLGMILGHNQMIKVRQVTPKFQDKLKLRLLNDDQNTEQFIEFDHEWQELNVSTASVPFVDTPYHGNNPCVEILYDERKIYDERKTKRLPVYHKGDNESKFFSLWNNQNAEFGLVESRYFIMLVPNISRSQLEHLEEVNNIDGLISYYEDVFTFYNTLAGISFQPQSPYDLNVPNRYFFKADKHNGGGTYYSNDYTAFADAVGW